MPIKKRDFLCAKTWTPYALAAVFVLAISVVGYAGVTSAYESGIERFQDSRPIAFSEGWSLTQSDGLSQTVSLPFANTVSSVPVTVSHVLPQTLPQDAVLHLQIYHNAVTAFVNGEQRPVEGVYTNRIFGSNGHAMWGTIPLLPQDAGQTVTLCIAEKTKRAELNLGQLEIINQNQLTHRLFKEKALPVFLFICMLTLSVMLLLISFIGRSKNKNFKYLPLFYLSLFIFLSAAWILTDSKILTLLLGYNDGVNLLSFYTFMLMPLPFVLYLQEMLQKRNAVLTVLSCLLIASFFGSTALLMCGVIDSLIQTIFITHFLILALCATILYLTVTEFLHHQNPAMRRMLFGILALLLAALLAVYLFYRDVEHYLNAFIVGIFAFVLFLCFDALQQTSAVLQEAFASSANRTKAKHAENHLKISQIGTHFFYHVLSSTRVLIKTNPDAAYKMLGDFSQYLRYNTDSSSTLQGLVPFCEELKAIQAYIDLKKVLLGDRLHVHTEIACEDFYIPVLSIQPLVENAIEHGIEKKPGGGTVWISTTQNESHYIVTIRDDGIGFEPQATWRQGNLSVSHSNIRTRLLYYGNNVLEICSKPGEGTLVVVRFEKELEHKHNENYFS